MAFIIVFLLLLILFRERYYTQKLWFHEKLVEETPFDCIMMDEKWRFRIISSGAIKDPIKRRWLIGKTDMDYWVHHRQNPEPAKKRLEVFKRALANRKEESIEETMLDRDGNERVHLRMVKPIFDSKGAHRAAMKTSTILPTLRATI
jgi:hypothetical protein